MENVINIILNFAQNAQAYVAAVAGVVAALIGLFMLIPGDQPEKFLRGVADFIGKYLSRKP